MIKIQSITVNNSFTATLSTTFFKQITLNIFTSKYKTGEKNIKGNLVAKGQLAVYKYFSIYAEGCQANEQKLRV